jgi:hypothetical protein
MILQARQKVLRHGFLIIEKNIHRKGAKSAECIFFMFPAEMPGNIKRERLWRK